MPAAPAQPQPKPKPKSKPKSDKTKIEKVKTRIKKQILDILGKPPKLWRVDVHLYNHGKARVNIWQSRKREPIKGTFGQHEDDTIVDPKIITDSHYLWLSKTATIEKANPPLERKY
ncbi:MAG: hypothetical protein JRD89_02105 [Deltaproteobacteria bacterium]|nr:hypothetical protein [Deltaproteobacteria bacterium]